MHDCLQLGLLKFLFKNKNIYIYQIYSMSSFVYSLIIVKLNLNRKNSKLMCVPSVSENIYMYIII